jgi:ABC-2 type transport system permease protein
MIETKRTRDIQSLVREALQGAGREANQGYAFVERGLYFTKRYWAWEAVWVTYNIVNALAVTFIAASAEKITGQSFPPELYNLLVVYLAIGTAVWTYISVVFDSVTETVTIERWEGTIEYTFMAPISRITHMVGICSFAIIHGLLMTAVQLFVMSMFFHMDLSHANWGAVLVLVLIGSVSLIGLGTVSAVLPMLFTERGAQMAYIIRAILLLISGVYYPITVLPTWMQTLAMFSPVTYLLQGLRASILQGKGLVELWPDIWPLFVSGVVLVPFGLYVFNLAERYAKRTGRLKRNG